ncbi:MAG: DUF6443 domain-containing protein [Candidatus Pseudobacter hemicellulosilyticus]|uniref:DUF6443 domain-containing protein n=1 Tax=Candidatus Pseudobacter hemicellulosilyticus TaxID=3121375 RepID=A0AAJ5WQH1_9BACT|nr:MAG: DUF6443 domain-containing protein [Pseudobacter sp.]
MRLLFILLFSFTISNAFSQSFAIEGSARVQPGDIVLYNIVGPENPTDYLYEWIIEGGTVLAEDQNRCVIQWDQSATEGHIVYVSYLFLELAERRVRIGGVHLEPISQVTYFNGIVQNICPVFEDEGVTYSWEMAVSGGQWQNVAGVTTGCFKPAAVADKVAVRCLVSGNGWYDYSDIAYVEVPALNPGSITLAQQPDYNSAAQITSTPASYGYCSSLDYQYTWEMSTEGGTWIPIGNTQQWPLSNYLFKANSQIRRKTVCGNDTRYSNTLQLQPVYFPEIAENRNFLREISIAKRGVQSWMEIKVLDAGEKFQRTSYLDGLGRTVQKVDKGISLSADNGWRDMVSFTIYDNLGRSTRQYLPYPSATDPGLYKTAAATEQLNFYSTNFNESNSWGKVEMENNPLNRVLRTIDPGTERLSNNIGNSFEYDYNNSYTDNEKVHSWRIGYTPGDLPVTAANEICPDGKLVKNISINDKGKKVIEYKDLDGNLVLKKVQLEEAGDGLSNEHAGWLCTYQVYDDFNRLRYIITPKAVAYLDVNNWIMSREIADELCFYYEYDEKGRVIYKKSPGAAPLSLVYDHRDRLVFTQDGNQAAKTPREWVVNFYDELDRVIATGIYRSDLSVPQLQHALELAAVTNTYTVPYNNELQTITITTDGPSPVTVNDAATYTAMAFNYYDNYGFEGRKQFDAAFANNQAYGTSDPNIEPIGAGKRVAGMGTGSRIRVLGTSTFLYTTVYYDESGNPVQVLKDNYRNGTDIATTQYHFDGRVMSVHVKHGAPGNIFNNFSILTKNNYNKIGQLISVEKKFGSANFKKIASYTYDEFGRPKTKKIGEKAASSDPLETFNYSYNITGLLTGINKDYALSSNNSDQWTNYFGIYLGYENFDNRFDRARFDGKLTGLIWKTQGDNTPRKYDFDYDNAGRFIRADFTQRSALADNGWSAAKMDFSESNILYDENGNLKQLYRKGNVPGIASPLFIDKLVYTYKQVAGGQWSNQLLKVFDNDPGIGGPANGSLGDFKDEVYNSDTDDYQYDLNGNLIRDNNKKIRDGSNAGISYNYLDKPEKIILENKSVVEFVYDASGAKLVKKLTPAGGTAHTTYYVGAFVYEESELQFILHEEGRLRIMTPVSNTSPLGASSLITNGNVLLTGGKWGVYDYFVKDHMGSVRMVLTEETHQEIYQATMENSAAGEEEPLFGKVDNQGSPRHPGNELYNTRYAKPVTWSSNSTGQVSKLYTTGTGSTKSVGPNILLKVMGGDYIHATSRYYYDLPTGSVGNQHILSSLVNSILGGLSGAGVGQSIKDGIVPIGNTLQDPVVSPLLPFLNNRPTPANDRPKAYLNYIFFDENFNYIGDGSGAVLVSGQANDGSVTQPNIRAPKNGYAYVYLSNESDWPVYFDDLIVSHERGAIVQEAHYYPYGLKIDAISSRAFNKLENRYGFQAGFSEEEAESDLLEYDLRMYDAQIGRWNGIDPYDEFASPYCGMGNDPVNNLDINGGQLLDGLSALQTTLATTVSGFILGTVTGLIVDPDNAWQYAGWGAGIGAAAGIGINLFGPGIEKTTSIIAISTATSDANRFKMIITKVYMWSNLVFDPVNDSYYGIIETGTLLVGGDLSNGIEEITRVYTGPTAYGGLELTQTVRYLPAPKMTELPKPAKIDAHVTAPQLPSPPGSVETARENLRIDFVHSSDQIDPDTYPDAIRQIKILARAMNASSTARLTLTGNAGFANPDNKPVRILGPARAFNNLLVYLNGQRSTTENVTRARAMTVRNILIRQFRIDGTRINARAGVAYNDPFGRFVGVSLR